MPSSAMAKTIRLWPSRPTSSTEVKPPMMPSFTATCSQWNGVLSMASAIGAALPFMSG